MLSGYNKNIRVITYMKTFLFLLSYLSVPCYMVYAQGKLDTEANMFRANDTIVKQQVEYKNPGKMGEDIFWNFGKLKPVDEKYTIVYTEVSDTTTEISGTEHKTRYFYDLQNDSLLLLGYENATTRVRYEIPEMILYFPMKFGDKIGGYFRGKGIYCDKLDVEAYGSSQSLVDATGVLILPNSDTLKHVIRIRTIQLVSEKILSLTSDSLAKSTIDKLNSTKSAEVIRKQLESDSAVLMVDTHRWYAAGYRYPVFETVRTGKYRDQNKTSYFTTAFFYPPLRHLYVTTDSTNKRVQDELRKSDLITTGNGDDNLPGYDNNSKTNQSQNQLKDEIEFACNVYPNPVESQLTFEFYLSKDASVTYALYNIAGSLLYLKRPHQLRSGAYSDLIDMGRLLRGQYILSIQVNGKRYSEKIIKR